MNVLSIITVTYNAQNHIRDTLESIRRQNFSDYELIIIDGDSKDDTLKMVAEYKDIVSKVVSEPDQGIYDAMNKGIRYCTGRWILFLNAGDIFYDENVLSNIFIEDNLKYEVLYGNSFVIDNKKNEKLLMAKEINQFNLTLWGTRVVCHQSIFVSKKIIPFFNLKYSLKGELDSYFKLARLKEVRVKKLDFTICRYSLGGKGDVEFLRNLKEQFAVVFDYMGFIGIILMLPVICYKILRKIC